MRGEIVLRWRWAGAVDPFSCAQGSITHPLQKTQRMGHPDSYLDSYADSRLDGGLR